MVIVRSKPVSERPRPSSEIAMLYEQHGRMVYNVCLRVLSNPSAAEDATQAVFLLLMRKTGSLQQHPQLAGWLQRTAELVAREGRRADLRRQKREQEAVKMAQDLNSTTPELDSAWSEIRPRLDRAIAELPDRYRSPLVMVYLEGQEQKEVARVLNLHEGTLRWRLSHAVERL